MDGAAVWALTGKARTALAVGRVPAIDSGALIDLGRANLHKHVSAMERPAHLLLLDHPLADEGTLELGNGPEDLQREHALRRQRVDRIAKRAE